VRAVEIVSLELVARKELLASLILPLIKGMKCCGRIFFSFYYYEIYLHRKMWRVHVEIDKRERRDGSLGW
jgi:hypothetical protein